ncbi:MAG TPA: hypothetical protein VGF99_13060, partial [Myxococcota bacterium]
LALTLPTVTGLLWTTALSSSAALLDEAGWAAVMIVVRAIFIASSVVAAVGVRALAAAPAVPSPLRHAAVGLAITAPLASLVALALPPSLPKAMVPIAFGGAAQVAILVVAMTVSRAVREEGAPQGVWRAAIALTTVTTAMTLLAVSVLRDGLFTPTMNLIELVVIVVAFVGLRRALR